MEVLQQRVGIGPHAHWNEPYDGLRSFAQSQRTRCDHAHVYHPVAGWNLRRRQFSLPEIAMQAAISREGTVRRLVKLTRRAFTRPSTSPLPSHDCPAPDGFPASAA